MVLSNTIFMVTEEGKGAEEEKEVAVLLRTKLAIQSIKSCQVKITPQLLPLKNMVEIECPLCAESIDLGMAEEEEYYDLHYLDLNLVK
ncbi:hypothetical protein OAJ13_00805 [Euryarchaeota archaeon]|nr:hypothetical protein [Euryarchaeota archaeon]